MTMATNIDNPTFAPDTPSPATPADPAAGMPNGSGSDVVRIEALERMVKTAHEAIDRLAEQAAPKIDRVQRGLADASTRLHQTADQALQVGDEWTESLRGTVRSNPVAAVATAFALGMLIARLGR